MASKKSTAQQRRERAARMRAERARHERRRKIMIWGVATVVALGAAGGIAAAVATTAGHGTPHAAASPSIPASPRTRATGRTTAPPWPAPSDVQAAVKAAGLPMLSSEGTRLHIHAHLDVIVDGKKVTVPQAIGIDTTHEQISPLHTHDTSGVIHIESPVKADFTLGQFLTEWQVAASANHLGSLKTNATHTLTTYVDGKKVTGNPAAIKLAAHQEIALVYGPTNQHITIPTNYTFPQGE